MLCLSGMRPIAPIAPALSQASPTPTSSPTPIRQPNPNEFPPNPLEMTDPDPLLPRPPVDRPLSPLERRQLIQALDQLNTQAQAQLQAGNIVGAFDTWNRELRLRRALGTMEEVTALGRVGDIAWRENQVNQVQIITGRLRKIQAETIAAPVRSATLPERYKLLEALGTAYQQVRATGDALNVYQQILTEARQRRDNKREVQVLATIGQLHMAWFDYDKAAATYRELLALAQKRGDRPNQGVYLDQLAYIHEQAKQPAQAIPYLQQLVAFYQTSRNPLPIPALKLRLGDNYQLVNRPDLAEQSYRETYTLAQPLAQLAYASDALKKLAVLYRANSRLDSAIRVYEFLVGIEQQAYNAYGAMDAYDQIGQIYLSRKAYPQAIEAFRKGLAYARQLNYRVDYFTSQIQQASQPTVAP